MRHADKLNSTFRQAIFEGRLPGGEGGVNTERLTALTLALGVVKRFHEGQYGKIFTDKLEEARQFRLKDPEGYARAAAGYSNVAKEISGGRVQELRLIETLTTSDLAYALGTTQDTIRRDNRPPFATALLDPSVVRRRTVDNTLPVQARGGVELLHRFLKRRPEDTNTEYTGWIGRGEYYTIAEWELGLSFTRPMLLNDKYGELQDAAYELGQNAARTRPMIVLDAIYAFAPSLVLPHGSNGPDLTNMQAVLAYMADQTINGRGYSTAPTDVYFANLWRVVANATLNTQSVPATGGGAGAVPNPVYQGYAAHPEPVFGDITTAEIAGFYKKDFIAMDSSKTPIEFTTLRGYEAGAKTFTQVADVVELDVGSFDNSIFRVKLSDYCGAGVADKSGVLRVSGQDGV